MTKAIQQKLSDSKGARWTALLIVSLTMMAAYFFTDVMSPLEPLLTDAPSTEFFAPTAGTISEVLVEENQNVKKGDVVIKVKNGEGESPVTAIADGKVKSIENKVGKSVSKDDIIVKIEYPDSKVIATEPCQVSKIFVAEDQFVKQGDVLVSLDEESGKQNITADYDGIVKSIKATEGQKLAKDDIAIVIERKVDVTPSIGKPGIGLNWTSDEYGFFSGSYGFFNVFLLLLFFGGIILDKFGIRFTGILSTGLMVGGALIKWYALSNVFEGEMFGYQTQVIVACLGFATYGVGCEIAGITVSKVIVKWFTGHELALAMGLQVGLARLGTAGALSFALPFAKSMGAVSAPVAFGAAMLCIGLIAFIVYNVMDKKEDKARMEANTEAEEGFKFSDLKILFTNRGFWYITLLCLMFYAGVFPFLKFATKLMVIKYGVAEDMAGSIPSMLPYGTIVLTPLFGSIYDKIGKGATLMIIGSILLTIVHTVFALPFSSVAIAIAMMVLLGIAFGLVPSAMWPSVPKIIPMQLLGTAYALIFYIQNIGLSMVPIWIGKVNQANTDANGIIDYTQTMSIFAGCGVVAIVIAFLLLLEDKKKGYGLQQPNVKK